MGDGQRIGGSHSVYNLWRRSRSAKAITIERGPQWVCCIATGQKQIRIAVGPWNHIGRSVRLLKDTVVLQRQSSRFVSKPFGVVWGVVAPARAVFFALAVH